VLRSHSELGGRAARARTVVAFRHDLTADQTGALTPEHFARGELPQVSADQESRLRERDRRYRRQLLLRRLGLGKDHKPKLLSANFSTPWPHYREINGFDETYVGYGQEDDDLGRRLYRAGGLPVVAVAAIPVYHLYHDTRAPGKWEESPNAAR